MRGAQGTSANLLKSIYSLWLGIAVATGGGLTLCPYDPPVPLSPLAKAGREAVAREVGHRGDGDAIGSDRL